MSGFHSGVDEDSVLLGYDRRSLGNCYCYPTF